jgi:hypothetical protein
MTTRCNVHVDCEFTDFIDCDLISSALVADNGPALPAA